MTEPAAKPTLFGMALDLDDDAQILSCAPVCGFLVIKALDEEGEVLYLAAATEGLKSVECLGMMRYTILKLEHRLTKEMDEEGEDD